MNIFWLQQTAADVPIENDWLCANEALRLAGMRFAKRRADWRLGRWTAKCAVATYFAWPAEASFLDDIEVRASPSGAPEVFIADRRAEVAVSLSHRGGIALAVIAAGGAAVGCDLEIVESRIDAFLADYFTPEEQLLVREAPAGDQAALVSLLWSAKESALKALGQGLRLDTRSMVVKLADTGEISHHNNVDAFAGSPTQASQQHAFDCGRDGWRALQVLFTAGGRTLHGCWERTGNLVRTVVADMPLSPVFLRSPKI